jgi:hypothetical protein
LRTIEHAMATCVSLVAMPAEPGEDGVKLKNPETLRIASRQTGI